MSLDSILRATGKNLLPNPNVHAYNYSLDYKKYNNTDEIFLTAGTYSVSVSANCPTLQFWNVTTKQQYTVDEAVSAYSTNTYYKVYEGYALGRASDAVRQMWFTLKINALITLNSGNTNGTSQECQIEKGSTATTYEPYEYLGPKTIKMSSNSKNLIPYPYATASKTISGVTFTVQEDGGIKVTGTATAISVFTIRSIQVLEKGKQYTFSGYTSGSGVYLVIRNTGSVVQAISLNTQNQTKTFTANYLDYIIAISVPKNTTVDAVFYPQLEEGTVATNYELNTGSKEVLKVSYNSRNFFDKTNYSVQSYKNVVRFDISKLKIGEQYTISSNLPLYWIKISDRSDGWNSVQQTSSTGIYNYTFIMQRNPNIPASATTQYLFLGIENGKMITDINAIVDYNIQVELGDKVTDYVPYFNTVVWTKKA